jgi:serine/threonine protein kinase/formylglycine-generating enzyme required for sulfatase activity
MPEPTPLPQAPTVDNISAAESEPSTASTLSPRVPACLGRYRLVRPLGAGGYGVVYKARDDVLQRDVAVKVPHRTRVASPEDIEQYLTEARILASLDHPGIVPVYDFGQAEDGLCYVVSKYIEGSDLRARLQQARPALADAVAIVAAVAEALHHAHQRGLVHRDVKPANILLDDQGKAYVVDFGLALQEKDLGHGPVFAGTVTYMSPEQARGEGHLVDGRTDIYSLGVIFFELLTGQRPFRTDSRQDLLYQIRTREPVPPRQLDSALPRELDRICLKALARRAADRYSTAQDLAEDLRHWLTFQDQSSTHVPSGPPSSPAPAAPPAVSHSGTHSGTGISTVPVRIVPKGLRAFEAIDADFFLELLPGPRDRDGLPESVRFWKTRLEETDGDRTFRVGLVYGPSGCGKSSLVRAGLLPRLAGHVLPVYVEATPGDTEARLLKAVRKRCPDVPAGLGLTATLASLRRGQGLPAGKKLVLVLDQLEQWLHAQGDGPGADLVQALRQCDAEHVQAMLLVRDDFWMATTRFMRELEIPLVEGENSAAVDLFDPRHARRVLAAYGRAFGALPEGPLPPEAQRFLDQAVAALARDNKIISVRLALFAEMVKGKPWTPATLKEVGGAQGVGMTFLEETFSAPTAPPLHRRHQGAARAVLRALLPEEGTEIKGRMRAHAELLAASGYERQPAEFDELLHLLNAELRLVTPADPTGEPAGAEASDPPAGGRYYQLTHDYLVPALRQWLTRKQKETWRGRAELLLEERAAQWAPSRAHRLLPSLPEYLFLRLGVRPGRWKPKQRALMRAAARRHGLTWGLALLALILAAIGVLQYVAAVHRATDLQRAETLVDSVLNASPAEVANAIQSLRPLGELARPILRSRFEQSPDSSSRKRHAAFGLADLGEVEVDFLLESLDKAPVREAGNILTALAQANDRTAPALLQRVARERDPEKRAHQAIALLHLGDAQGAQSVLELSPVPTYRTAFIHQFAAWHGDLRPLPGLLRQQGCPGLRSGLCAALGLVDPDSLALDVRGALQESLVHLYRNAPDGGTHSAAGWALRQWKAALPALEASTAEIAGRGWFVNLHGMTMLEVPAGTFLMGDPREKGLEPHEVTLTRPFFVCDREVWPELFRQFAEDPAYPAAKKSQEKWDEERGYSWHHAVLFCNWLSVHEGRRPCYRHWPPVPGKKDAEPASWQCDFTANGYRLPTEAEWEYVCRAGTTTAFSFGDEPDLLPHYGFFYACSRSHVWQGGLKLPNAWGLFDMHGNLDEWCWDWYSDRYPTDKKDPQGPRAGTQRVQRGGSFLSNAESRCQSGAPRYRALPDFHMGTTGFRVVCTKLP